MFTGLMGIRNRGDCCCRGHAAILSLTAVENFFVVWVRASGTDPHHDVAWRRQSTEFAHNVQPTERREGKSHDGYRGNISSSPRLEGGRGGSMHSSPVRASVGCGARPMTSWMRRGPITSSDKLHSETTHSTESRSSASHQQMQTTTSQRRPCPSSQNVLRRLDRARHLTG